MDCLMLGVWSICNSRAQHSTKPCGNPPQILQYPQKGLGTVTLSLFLGDFRKHAIRNWSQPSSGLDVLSHLGGCCSLWAMCCPHPISKNIKPRWILRCGHSKISGKIKWKGPWEVKTFVCHSGVLTSKLRLPQCGLRDDGKGMFGADIIQLYNIHVWN